MDISCGIYRVLSSINTYAEPLNAARYPGCIMLLWRMTYMKELGGCRVGKGKK